MLTSLLGEVIYAWTSVENAVLTSCHMDFTYAVHLPRIWFPSSIPHTCCWVRSIEYQSSRTSEYDSVPLKCWIFITHNSDIGVNERCWTTTLACMYIQQSYALHHHDIISILRTIQELQFDECYSIRSSTDIRLTNAHIVQCVVEQCQLKCPISCVYYCPLRIWDNMNTDILR